ncbi:MAG: VOC family protein [Pseudomonadota bacterium]
MAIVGLDHIQIAIPENEEEKARGFYRDLLGLLEVTKPANLSPNGCWFACGMLGLHLGVDPDFKPSKKSHPAFLVDDLRVVEKALRAAGYPIVDGKPIAGSHRTFTQDPFGNRIELMQSLS